MEISGVLGWPPQVFWSATFPELLYSLRGWQIANGIDPEKTSEAPMTRAELNALMEQFPDG